MEEHIFSKKLRNFLAALTDVYRDEGLSDGENFVIDGKAFDPLNFVSWLPDIVVAAREDDEGFIYRIYGENAALLNGRNLLGERIDVWPHDVRNDIQSQIEWISEHKKPSIVRFIGNRFSRSVPGEIEQRSVVCEKIMFPLVWGTTEINGFLTIIGEITSAELELARANAPNGHCQCQPERSACNCGVFSPIVGNG